MGIAGKRILKALIQLKNPASAEEIVKHLAKTSRKSYELLRTDVMETITIAKKLHFIDFKNGLYSYTIATKKTRKKHAKTVNKNRFGFNTEERCQYPLEGWIIFDDTAPPERVVKDAKDDRSKLNSMEPNLYYVDEYNEANKPPSLTECNVVKKLEQNVSVEIKKKNNPFLRKRFKRCAPSDGVQHVPNKKRKVASNGKLNLGPQRKLDIYMPSDHLSKNRRGTPKGNYQTPTGQTEKRNSSSDYGNATHFWSHSHLLSRVEKQPVALDESYIQYKIHHIIGDLAKLKNNLSSRSSIQHLSNSNVGASFRNCTKQSDIENFVERPNHFFKTYANQSETNELVEKKIIEVIRQYDLFNSFSGVSPEDTDSVKTTIHQIIDDYININESCDDSFEKKSAEIDSVDSCMDEGPGYSWWDYPK